MLSPEHPAAAAAFICLSAARRSSTSTSLCNFAAAGISGNGFDGAGGNSFSTFSAICGSLTSAGFWPDICWMALLYCPRCIMPYTRLDISSSAIMSGRGIVGSLFSKSESKTDMYSAGLGSSGADCGGGGVAAAAATAADSAAADDDDVSSRLAAASAFFSAVAGTGGGIALLFSAAGSFAFSICALASSYMLLIHASALCSFLSRSRKVG